MLVSCCGSGHNAKYMVIPPGECKKESEYVATHS